MIQVGAAFPLPGPGNVEGDEVLRLLTFHFGYYIAPMAVGDLAAKGTDKKAFLDEGIGVVFPSNRMGVDAYGRRVERTRATGNRAPRGFDWLI